MLGRSVGLSDDEMAGMADPETVPTFDAIDRLVLRYAETSTRSLKISDALFAELEAAFPREQLLELCFTVGLSALVNRVHATFQTDLDPETEAIVGAAPSCPIGR
jgi:alkylhydroperoxidase family enzyme